MVYDILIIGSGPAGLTAAIYASRANKNVLVIEKESLGGLMTHSPKIENYPAVACTSGMDLADKMVAQAMSLGVNFEFDSVNEIIKNENEFVLKCEHNDFIGKSVIIATGSKHRTLKLNNEEKFVGKGISYCAVCDGAFYTGKDVCVIGGGNSAMQEAIMLSSYCKSVTMFQNLPFLTGEKALAEKINDIENIKVVYNKTVVELLGDENLSSIILQDSKTNEKEAFNTTSIFVAIGQEANNQPFANVCYLDENGFIITNDTLEAKIEGIFVAGDCKVKKIRQIVTACSDGAIAALSAIKYLDK